MKRHTKLVHPWRLLGLRRRGWLLLLAVGTTTASGRADEETPRERGYEADFHHRRYELGVSATLLHTFEDTGIEAHPGGSVSLTWAAIPARLEFEFIAQAITDKGGVQLPFDLLVRVPFELTPWCYPYLGIGPTIVPYVQPGDAGIAYGVASAFGADVWFSHHLGIFAEGNYNVVSHGHWRQEIGGGAGLLIGW